MQGSVAFRAITLDYWRNGSLRRAYKKVKRVKGAPGIDAKRGRWRYRFQVRGHPRVVVVTGLEATRENLGTVKKLRDAHRLRLQLGEPEPIKHVLFSEAADRFLAYKRAKHRDKPATAKRIATSMASWREFMGQRSISGWKRGDVLDYLTWRRETGRLEVTLRKDVLAGRQCARFALDQRWLEDDPFIDIEVPSDRDSRNETGAHTRGGHCLSGTRRQASRARGSRPGCFSIKVSGRLAKACESGSRTLISSEGCSISGIRKRELGSERCASLTSRSEFWPGVSPTLMATGCSRDVPMTPALALMAFRGR